MDITKLVTSILKEKKLEYIILLIFAGFFPILIHNRSIVFQLIPDHISKWVLIICIPVLLTISTYLLTLNLSCKPKLKPFCSFYWDNKNNLYCPKCKTLLTFPTLVEASSTGMDSKILRKCPNGTCLTGIIPLVLPSGMPINFLNLVKLKNNPNLYNKVLNAKDNSEIDVLLK